MLTQHILSTRGTDTAHAISQSGTVTQRMTSTQVVLTVTERMASTRVVLTKRIPSAQVVLTQHKLSTIVGLTKHIPSAQVVYAINPSGTHTA
eukprot:516176-Rhodomonas_salina.1